MKLLQKTIRSYFIYSVCILLIAIPVFYISIERIVLEDVDESLLATKEKLKPKISAALQNKTIEQLAFLDHNITVSSSVNAVEFDSFKTIELYDSVSSEIVPNRVLTSQLTAAGKPYLLQIKTSLVENEDLIESIVKVQITLLILLLTGLFFINKNLAKKIWKPFYSTLEKLRSFKVENAEPLSLSKSGIHEFEDLNNSLRELTDRTRQTYISQKEFTENASHEMQTPLAVFQSKLELLMQTIPINQDQAGLMDDLADASHRMSRLNKSLVLLTKIDNNQFAEKERVSLNRLIEHFVLQYEPQTGEKRITVQTELQADVMVEANKVLIEILVSNLLGNAIRHNHVNGSIDILLQTGQLIIRNSGKSSAIDEHKLFQRFQKESTDSKSIGLGLEIVKKICMLYGYKIVYRFKDSIHEFSVKF